MPHCPIARNISPKTENSFISAVIYTVFPLGLIEAPISTVVSDPPLLLETRLG